MRLAFLVPLIIVTASIAAAQDKLCKTAAASSIDRASGITVEKITLTGAWGSGVATVVLPDKEIVQAAVVFSHSEIHPDGRASVDLLPLAMTLARAGAAVIVPERSLNWLPTDRTMNREGAVVTCAAHWIADNTKVVNDGKPLTNEERRVLRWGYAYVGPRLCDPHASECRLMMPFNDEPQPASPHDRVAVWVPVGETEGGDNTNSIISDRGLQAARWLQHQLGLAPIQSIIESTAASL